MSALPFLSAPLPSEKRKIAFAFLNDERRVKITSLYLTWRLRGPGEMNANDRSRALTAAYGRLFHLFSLQVLIGSHDGQLYCIDVRGCRSVWEMQCQASVFATPAIGMQAGAVCES